MMPVPRFSSQLLSPAQKILLVLYRYSKPISPVTIILVSGLAPSVTYYNLRKLEKTGLVGVVKTGKREQFYITEKGRKKVKEMLHEIKSWISEIN